MQLGIRLHDTTKLPFAERIADVHTFDRFSKADSVILFEVSVISPKNSWSYRE